MSGPTTTKQADKKDSTIMLRAAITSAVLLGIALNLIPLVTEYFAANSPDFKQKLGIGLELFVIWLVLTSTLRSIHKMRPETDAYKFLLAGIIIVIGGVLLQFIFGALIGLFNKEWVNSLDLKELGFYAVIGFIASLISMINLKVKNQFLGNILEVLVIGLVIFLFYHFMR